MRIGIYGYSNRGAGHIVRMRRLAAALAPLDLLWLGHVPPEASTPLPRPHAAATEPLDSMAAWSRLYDRMTAHGEKILQLVREQPVDLLITEYFPFARLLLEAEIIPVLSEVKASGGKIVASMRDVGGDAPWRMAIALRTTHLLNQYFDLVLWHGDKSFLPFDFPVPGRIQIPIVQTGYVSAPPQARAAKPKPKRIIVSVGRGRTGAMGVVRPALEAFHTLVHEGWDLMLLPGEGNIDMAQSLLDEELRPHVTIKPWLPTLIDELSTATVSISQCGYNTFTEVVRSGARGIFIPYGDPGDEEQALRANRIGQYPGFRCLMPGPSLGEQLVASVREVSKETPAPPALALDGATVSRRHLLGLLPGHPGGGS